MYIKLLSTGACANINIREIMLISIISSVVGHYSSHAFLARSFLSGFVERTNHILGTLIRAFHSHAFVARSQRKILFLKWDC